MGAKVLIVGAGGREHALGWKIRQSRKVSDLYFAPGNAGTGLLGKNVEIGAGEIDKLVKFAKDNKIALTMVGPEVPLEAGIVDAFEKAGLLIFGPTRKAALLETDKSWATAFMERHNIPHPKSLAIKDYKKALDYIKTRGPQKIVIKATGLAAGKGVFLPASLKEAQDALRRIMKDEEFGPSREVLIQERLLGREVSQLAFCDGKTIVPMLPAQDHKRINDSDRGPNTGGMGAFAPVQMDAKLKKEIYETILERTIDGMRREGHIYKGVLYAGLMITGHGPKVLEYNARFGDPETQPLMMLLASDLFGVLKSCANGTLKSNLVSFRTGAALCVVLASGGYPGEYKTGKTIGGLDINRGENIEVFHAGTKNENGKIVTNGGRVLGVTAFGKTMPEARRKVYSAIGTGGVYFAGMHLRHDIGKVLRQSKNH
ncbi:MAG: phosphoribosylamine--glycine ligase [Candidatus Curtissbacteria bacterium]|nr:phosphoribosylamine--glycine ligase [Candidatus Curtissbacteria bacterium]